MSDKLKLKYSKKPVKGDIYNLRHLKVLIDEILVDFLVKDLNYKLNNTYTDFQISVGLLSTVLAALLTYFSMNFEFKDYKVFMIWCLCIYSVLNGIVYIFDTLRGTTYYFTKVIKNNVQEDKNDKETEKVVSIRVCTEILPPNPIYTLLVYKDNKLIPEKWSKSVFELFKEDGTLNASQFLDDVTLFFNK
ncbi:hypothetical protein NCER_101840 [Vairimorpha ceranae BRL01]|uniref:Signal peptidase complex subunit 2 n=2 Tax=Vairimorpha ceranae TaxID=40302 RepID=C4VAV7_VAIC1|nr:signal peptidase 21kda subunit [Vairimorpha ceranae]EEQ81647.1 hypothetical protein NCER_101840 [Vairimorpha ceranae BRL01]KAF5140317.1 hypothetical protein G9O61_00g015730 [Vairimorpha ceranae]KKO75527.1 signal peptidase 21kda subunit [Vairimorpha ceranae]